MVIRWLKLAIVLVLISSVSIESFAQAPQGSNATPEEMPRAGGPRRQLATIIFAGLGGAILGLSTLSFYGRPQDKLSNIAIGFAVGVITGTGYVTYKAATRPQEFYGDRPWIEKNGLDVGSLAMRGSEEAQSAMKLNWAFEF